MLSNLFFLPWKINCFYIKGPPIQTCHELITYDFPNCVFQFLWHIEVQFLHFKLTSDTANQVDGSLQHHAHQTMDARAHTKAARTRVMSVYADSGLHAKDTWKLKLTVSHTHNVKKSKTKRPPPRGCKKIA